MDSDAESIDERTYDNQFTTENSIPNRTRCNDYHDYEMDGPCDFDRRQFARTPKKYQQPEYREDSINGRKKGVALNHPMPDRRKR